MNTKLLMIGSAVVMGVSGIILSFMPGEVAGFFNLSESDSIIFQILGALYFGFAMLNWTAKGNLIGGIYSRPVAVGNFTHFLIGGLAIIKFVLHNNTTVYMWIVALVYLIFATLFGFIFFTNPALKEKNI